MGPKADGKAKKVALKKEVEAATPVFENPLVPHAVLREMYRKMVEMRLLDEYAGRLAKGRKSAPTFESTWGQEACRVSLTQGLGPGDLVMDAQAGELAGHLLGMNLKDALAGIRRGKGRKVAEQSHVSSRLLPFVEDAETRIFAGLGVAILARQMQRTDGVVIFVRHREVKNGTWRRALTLAAKQRLAVLFVVLAKSSKAMLKISVSGLAEKCGVPGIPVDASDSIALYRVAQESLGRMRSEGGPVLIEGIAFPATGAGKHKGHGSDPVTQMAAHLIQRQVASEAWMKDVDKSFRKQLATMKH